jgi:DNA-binding transcriptional LysR family regulator
MTDEFLKIRTFIDVVEHGSFSAAARHENGSVSALARRVSALEEDLGVRLVNRNTRSLSITDAGQLFYERACELVRDLESAKAAAASFQETVKGVLRVSLRVSVGVLILPLIKAFLEANPGLRIEVDLTDERHDLLKNGIDVAVWVGELDDSDLIARVLSPGRRLLCGSPDYFEQYGVPDHPDQLRRHMCLPHRATGYDGTWRFAKDGEKWTIQADGPFATSSGLALMYAARSGLGLVVLQHYMVAEDLRAGRLRAVMTDFDVRPRDSDAMIHAVYPHSRLLSPKARAFIDFLASSFAAADQPIPD